MDNSSYMDRTWTKFTVHSSNRRPYSCKFTVHSCKITVPYPGHRQILVPGPYIRPWTVPLDRTFVVPGRQFYGQFVVPGPSIRRTISQFVVPAGLRMLKMIIDSCLYSIILANGLLALLSSWSMFEYSRRFCCHFSCLLSFTVVLVYN
jgi:hypothetical protein